MSETIRIDPHVKLLSPTIVERAKRRGLDALVYAPHFTRLPEIRRRADRFSDSELRILPGREVFTGTWAERKHVLAIDLEQPVPDFISLDAAMAAFRRQHATVLVPHPDFATVGLSASDCRRYRRTIDGIEIYNPKHLPQHNRRAQQLQQTLNVPAFGSSYAHLPGTIGEVWTELTVDRWPLDDAALVEALVTQPRQVRHRGGFAHHGRSLLEFAHLGWENSWKKFNRVLLSGLEPTHPAQAAYDGRFDQAAVY